MQITYKNLATYTLYLYIMSLYVLAYDPRLNIISKILFLAVISTYALYTIKDKYITGGSIYLFAFAFMFYATLSSFWSIEFNYAFIRNITIYQVVLLMLVVYNLLATREDLDNIVQCIFWGGFLMCIYAILYYGPGEILLRMKTGVQMGAEINQENGFGAYCIITYAIGVFNIMYKKKWAYLLPTIIALLLSLASRSRRSVLVAIIVTGILVTMKKGKIKISKLLLYAIGICLLVAVFSKFEFFDELFGRFLSLIGSVFQDEGAVDGSYESRMGMIKFGFEKFKDNPIFGYGTDQFASLYDDGTGLRRPSHNNFIEILVNYGLIGFVIYYGFIFFRVKELYAGSVKRDQTAVIVFMVYCIELISHIATVVINNKFSFIYIAIIFAYGNIIKKEKNLKIKPSI